MTTYVVRREPGQRTPLSDLMQGLPPMPVTAEAVHYEPKRKGNWGPVRSELRKQLEAMAVGDQLETHERTASQVSAIAFNIRRHMPEARYRAKQMGTYTLVRRVS